MQTFCLTPRLLCATMLICLLALPLQADAARYDLDAIIAEGQSSQTPSLSGYASIFRIFALTNYEQFLLRLDEENSSLWTALSKRFEHEMEAFTLEHSPLDPEFAFGKDVVSQITRSYTLEEEQSLRLAQILFFSREKMPVKFTKASFRQLREDGVPEEILKGLQPLEEYEFSQVEDFEQALEQHLGTEQLALYKSSIYNRTAMFSPRSGLISPSYTINTWNTNVNTQVNIESWNAFFYYPQKLRNALTHKGEKKSAPENSEQKEEKLKIWFDALGFLKKWGVPAPLTVILIILAIYFTLNFLVRNR